jgi:hypothetical protein
MTEREDAARFRTALVATQSTCISHCDPSPPHLTFTRGVDIDVGLSLPAPPSRSQIDIKELARENPWPTTALKPYANRPKVQPTF